MTDALYQLETNLREAVRAVESVRQELRSAAMHADEGRAPYKVWNEIESSLTDARMLSHRLRALCKGLDLDVTDIEGD